MGFGWNWGAADEEDFLLTKAARGTSDYQIFLDAYSDWYGHEAASDVIDGVFGDYLKTGELPHFVRHYARRYVEANPDPAQALREWDRRIERAQAIAFGTLVILVLVAIAIT